MGKVAHAQRVMALCGLTLTVGCGFNLGDIDRTQPDKVKKAMFLDGKAWYFKQTVLDVPADSNISFVGMEGDAFKVEWAIDENFLFANRTHEAFSGSEEFGARPGVPYRGAPVAAYRIISHFDVQRQYNPNTGEQTNVIAENTTDRPWNEREYMRVDWSQNLIADVRFDGANVAQQPVTRYVREGENDKDAAKISADYIDVVTEMVAEPEVNEMYSEWYGFPIVECWLDIGVDCIGARLRVRNSFMKVSDEYVYEPESYDNRRMLKFGFFRIDRLGYDRNYGYVDDRQEYLASRHNIWKRRPGEQPCHDTSFLSAHPYAGCGNDRIKPIVYHVSDNMPAYLKNANIRIGAEWNRVFKEAVSNMTGRPVNDLPDVFILCQNNPVQDGDPAECGAPGLNPQLGDLRYNMVNYVAKVQKSSPWGYGPTAADPLTGMTISGTANVYGAVTEIIAQDTLDLVKLTNGQLTVDDYFQGSTIADHYARLQASRQARTAQSRATEQQWRDYATKMKMPQKLDRLRTMARNGYLSHSTIAERVESIRGTPWDALLQTNEMQRALLPQYASLNDVPPQMKGLLSAATLRSPTFMRMQSDRLTRLGAASIDMRESLEDESIDWVANILSCDPARTTEANVARFCINGQMDEMAAYTWLAEELHTSTTLHEIGHTVGLRHNFAGSTDALNYEKTYWELKADTLNSGTQQDLKPEFMLTTAREQQGLDSAVQKGLRGHQTTSIMDYGGKRTADFYGLGTYDSAAILYGYGRMVEVFDTEAAEDRPQITRAQLKLLVPGERHYTQYPAIVSSDSSYTYKQRIDSMYKRRAVPEAAVLASSDVVEVPYRFCSDEYVGGFYWCFRFDEGADAYEQVQSKTDMYEQYYFSYGLRHGKAGFGGNIMPYLDRIYNRYFDAVTAQAKHFLNNELIQNFFDAGCEQGVHYADAKCGMDRFVAAVNAVNFLGRVIQTPEPGCYMRRNNGCYLDSYDSVNGIPVSITKMDDAYCDTHGRENAGVATRVAPEDAYEMVEGSFDCSSVRSVTSAGNDIWMEPVEVKLGEGRYSQDKMDWNTHGYEFRYKPVAIGVFWDKILAMQALGDPSSYLLTLDERGDSHDYIMSNTLLFGNQINTMMGAFATKDYKSYGPRVRLENSKMTMRPRNILGSASEVFSGASQPTGPSYPLNPQDNLLTLKYQALFIGSAYYSDFANDQSFNEMMMIGKVGTEVDVTVADSIKNSDRYVELSDPSTGGIYFAVKVVPAEGSFEITPYQSAGYEYVKRVRDTYYEPGSGGKVLKANADLSGLRREIEEFNLIRSYVNLFGFARSSDFVF